MNFLKSILNAWAGLVEVWKNENNFRIQVIAGVIIFAMTFVLLPSMLERSIIVLLICAVLVSELINTAFERMSDILKPRIHPYIKQIKDILAAVVLVISISSVVIGVMIFIPRIIEFVK